MTIKEFQSKFYKESTDRLKYRVFILIVEMGVAGQGQNRN